MVCTCGLSWLKASYDFNRAHHISVLCRQADYSPLLVLDLLVLFYVNVITKLSNEDRNRALGQLQAGITAAQVARNFGVHEHTIRRLRQRHAATGSVHDRQRSGSPRETTRRQDRQIRLQHLRRRFTVPAMTARNTPGRTRHRISSRTVRRRLREAGIRARRPYCGSRLKRLQRRNRLQWARQHQRWPVQRWRQILFTDECKFQVDHNDRRQYVYRRRNERFADACVKERDRFGGANTMVWAGFSYDGRTRLVFLDRPRGAAGRGVTAQRYIQEVLRPVVVPFMQQNPGLVLQHDNAPPHAARMTTNFIQQQNIQTLPWPSMSPDMNPIENVWSYLKDKLMDNNLQTRQELRNFILREWNALPRNYLQGLVRSMRRRCTALVNAGGGHTRY